MGQVQGWITNASYKAAQTWSAQGAIVKWGIGENATKDMPLVMMNLTMSYGRQLQKFFPICQDADGVPTQINIGGAPRGTLQIGAIFAPYSDSLSDFLSAVAKECKSKADGVYLTIMPFGNQKCAGDGDVQEFNNNVSFTLKNVELETVGVSIQGGEVAIVNFPTNYSFTGLDLKI